MGQSNGNRLITILILASFGWATACFLMNQDSIRKLAEISNDCIHSIDLRLSRIEYKLDININEMPRLR